MSELFFCFSLNKLNKFLKAYRKRERKNRKFRQQERKKANPTINSPREMRCNHALEMLLINEWSRNKKNLWGIKYVT